MTGIVAVGECMIEFSRAVAGGDAWRLRHGGDTLNAATYLARLGHQVAYLTALGSDPFSEGMRNEWTAEGIDVSLVLTNANRLPGLYLIETDPSGERAFHYWREQSAARSLFTCAGIDAALAQAETADCLYLSGITLSLYDEAGRSRLRSLASAIRLKGGEVVFDPNYRARGWASPEEARRAFAAIAPIVTMALPTFDDEATLHGDPDPEATIARWKGHGVREVAVKLGPRGALVEGSVRPKLIPAVANHAARDTTGAGDSFNAAYLAARREGAEPGQAAAAGNALAAAVVRQPGAIIPRTLMPISVMRRVKASEG